VTERLESTVEVWEQGLRADQLLASRLPGLGRVALAHLFAEGRVRSGRHRWRKGDRLPVGERFEVDLPPPRHAQPNPSLVLEIRAESSEWVVINKPPGQHSVARDGDDQDALVCALLARFPELAGVGHGPLEPGLIHRLDAGTSGLLAAARSARAFAQLTAALSTGGLHKRYLALVRPGALPASGSVTSWLTPSGGRSPRVRCQDHAPEGAGAVERTTHWTVVERGAGAWTLEVTAERAYRHQIRSQLAFIGAPLLGDSLYGGDAVALPEGRHALHAHQLAWAGTATMAGFAVTEQLPADLRALLTGG
jgi:23S rRNA pseudouridine1911/1915/1917 synthase